MTDNTQLWRTADGARWFLVPADAQLPPGDLAIRAIDGPDARVDAGSAAPYEVSEDDGRAWAKAGLGGTLDELKHAIDGKLADLRGRLDEVRRTPVAEDGPLTPDAGPALLELIGALPGVIGKSLSGDAARVGEASRAMAGLRARLAAAGVDVDARLTDFPERLAGLREEAAAQRRRRNPEDNDR
ncbi:MAG: hypothetical protein ACHP7A_02165 [Caulobacterales bacterium]|jgi:hypothetical protein